MNWLSSIFGSGTVVDKGMDLIDNAFYTDEEKASNKIKLLDSFRPFALVQRGLAIATSIIWGIIVIVELTLAILSAWITGASVALESINNLEVVNTIGWGWMAVMTLYFTGGVISSMKKKD